MGEYADKLRQEKKDELNRKMSLALANDILEMSLSTTDAQEFVDYLMTITDEYAIEEFFNQCHDAGGKFCGGSSGGAVSGKAKGPRGKETKHGLKLNYTAKVNVAKIMQEDRSNNPKFKEVTRPFSIKLNKLAKTNLSKFSGDELQTLNTIAKLQQRENKVWSRVSLGIAATLIAATASPFAAPINTSLFIAESIQSKRYKTQSKRIEKELDKRNWEYSYTLSVEISDIVELSVSKGLSEADRALLPDFKKMLDELIEDNDGDFSEKEIIDLRNLRAAADKV